MSTKSGAAIALPVLQAPMALIVAMCNKSNHVIVAIRGHVRMHPNLGVLSSISLSLLQSILGRLYRI